MPGLWLGCLLAVGLTLNRMPIDVSFGFGICFLTVWFYQYPANMSGREPELLVGVLCVILALLRAPKLQQLSTVGHVENDNIEGCLLGFQAEKPVYLADEDANLHTLMVGTTGSGKTTTIANIVESAIKRSHPVIYVDGKGDKALASSVQAYAKDRGRKCYVFDMTGGTLKYNPIADGGYTSKKDRIIELRHWSEEHYRKLAEGYLQNVFRILEKLGVHIDVYQLGQYLDIHKLYLIARETKDNQLSQDIQSLESKVKDISSLIAEIEILIQSEIGHLFDTRHGECLTLQKALDEDAVVFFSLQPLAFPAYAQTLGKLIINDIKHLLASQLLEGHRKTIFTIFDEFSVFAGTQIVNLINQGRQAGACAVLATQSLSDIQIKGGQALVG